MSDKTKPCPHAHLRMEYAKDALTTDKPWKLRQLRTPGSHERVDAPKELASNPDTSYRHKPSTININGFEVPDPMREAPPRGSSYFYAKLIAGSDESWWSGDDIDHM